MRGADERVVHLDEAPVAIDQREPDREQRDQALDVRRGAGADRGLAAFLLVEQRDQDRRVVAVEERDLQDAQRVALGALALEPRLPLGVDRQEPREVAADHDAFLMPHRPFAQHAVGGEQLAVGRDQRRHDPGGGKPVAGRPGDQRLDVGGEV